MDNKEHTEAANALVGWFNSQEISKPDARTIMRKVMAKIIVAEAEPHNAPHQGDLINEEIIKLVNEVNLRLLQISRGK